MPTFEPVGMPALTLTRRDWDFLFDQLRSTTAVLDYLLGGRGAARRARRGTDALLGARQLLLDAP
ncbi:hypothetical protein [Streptomyces sp. IB2014 016-6]|uniref:hypothetical protein n=1 Tax=Streptomyces sp. IB2014 016-6 TaxID=2517818 RepID=UPI0011CB4918|nr:hypothetical protein [Streptomyces sp. IB2014 016-6]TXL84554.1 hypothetical protein EW053_34280 [Streptomyces sp. IB2014 016-6]